MSQKKISYIDRDFENIRKALIEYTQEYYPEIASELDDASIGTWFIELMAAVGDNLSYYIDKVYNETNVESAEMKNSIYAIARTNGLKIPGPKGSMTELQFSCIVPEGANGLPNLTFAPIIKKGSRVMAANGTYFETDFNVDFNEQFNDFGESDRNIVPIRNTNSGINYYRIEKLCTATAGTSKVYKVSLTSSQTPPFMEVLIPDRNVMGVDSIVVKDGIDYNGEPCLEEFMMPNEFIAASENGQVDTYRFFEVNSLAENYVWGDGYNYIETRGALEAVPEVYTFEKFLDNGEKVPVYSIAKGQWKPVTQKFVTEFTDQGYLKITFGGGSDIGTSVDISKGSYTARNQISHMLYNDSLGKKPRAGMTMFIRYRIGGGYNSNLPANTITNKQYINVINKNTPTTNAQKTIASNILSSIKVTNIIPAVAGKDAPTVDEIRNMIKYNNAALNRCVTIKDYEVCLSKMPSRYGSPFRLRAMEENNKVMLYLMMVDNDGRLSTEVPSVLVENIQNYLSVYRTINDYVEIKPARIVNLSFEFDIFADKNYDTGTVMANVIDTIKEYMDIKNHDIGEDIYVTDINRKIMNVEGVLSITSLRVYNEYGSQYSTTRISQQTDDITDTSGYENESERALIDLDASNYVLGSDIDEMFEIKYPDTDIKGRVVVR